MSDLKVAKFIRKAIDEFRMTNPKYLTQVDVVVFEQRMLGSFQTALTAPSTKSTKPLQPSVAQPVSNTLPITQNGDVTVNVTGGDILTSNCKVLINTTGGDFNLSGIILYKNKQILIVLINV